MAGVGFPHPSKYDGSGSFIEWQERFEQYSLAMEWNEEAQATRLPIFLEGQAYQAYRQLAQEDRKPMARLTAALQKATEKVAPLVLKQAQALKLERNPKETWDSYRYRLSNAIKVAYPEVSTETNDKMVATRLFEAFPKEIKSQILIRDVSSLKEMLRAAQLLESFSAWETGSGSHTEGLAPITTDRSSPNFSQSIQNSPPPYSAFRGNKPRQRGSWSPRADGSESERAPEPWKRGKGPTYAEGKSPTCDYCRRQGHSKLNCFLLKQQQGEGYQKKRTTQNQPQTCDYCHKKGHIKERCFALRKDMADWEKQRPDRPGNERRSEGGGPFRT